MEQTIKFKYCATLQKGKLPQSIVIKAPTALPVYLSMDFLRGGDEQPKYVEDFQKCVLAEDGDILILWDGSNAGEILLSKQGVVASTVAKVCVSEGMDKRFFYYHLKSIEREIKNASVGMGIPHVNPQELLNFSFLIPSLPTQTAIAAYLDRKTAEIDELIADKKRLLELYEEEKTAIINQAVTKGLNPDDEGWEDYHDLDNPKEIKPSGKSKKSRFRQSGIEWLGDIPAHWEVKKIGHCCKIVRGGSPRPTGDPRYFFGDYINWITVKEVTNAVGKYVVGTEEYLTEEGSKHSRIIEPETLLLSNSGATLGVPKISKIRGCINDGSVAFPELKSFLDRDYLYYFFVSHTDIYREQMAGNGQPNLNTEIIKSTFIPIPSTVEEQTAIVEFIESETQKVNAKKAKTERLIDLLTEYRTALISEVVTGKVKVV